MGRIMKEDDLYIPGLFDLLNLRFGPSQGPKEAFGGIDEMVILQREFEIFQRGRSLKDCFAVLNLGGFWNTRAKNRWLTLIDDLASYESDIPGENGNDRIMNMMIENLEARTPRPILFQAHDSREEGRQVIVRTSPTGLFFVEQEHIIVSIPMRPKLIPGAARKAAPTGRTARKTSAKTTSKAGSKRPRKTPGRR